MTDKDLQIFRKYIPLPAVSYCAELWLTNKFHLKITKPRNSKLGDYCYQPGKGHNISVNSNLNQYSFLITYLHEVAHLHVQKSNVRKKLPHGKEWKEAFRKLLVPVLNNEIFPDDVLIALHLYYKNPSASTGSHSVLSNTLRNYDQINEAASILNTLSHEELFVLNGRIFAKGQLRRTRFLCKELKSGKNYVILGRALVQKYEPST
jgi:SprT protein